MRVHFMYFCLSSLSLSLSGSLQFALHGFCWRFFSPILLIMKHCAIEYNLLQSLFRSSVSFAPQVHKPIEQTARVRCDRETQYNYVHTMPCNGIHTTYTLSKIYAHTKSSLTPLSSLLLYCFWFSWWIPLLCSLIFPFKLAFCY